MVASSAWPTEETLHPCRPYQQKGLLHHSLSSMHLQLPLPLHCAGSNTLSFQGSLSLPKYVGNFFWQDRISFLFFLKLEL